MSAAHAHRGGWAWPRRAASNCTCPECEAHPVVLFGALDPGEPYLYHYTSAEKLALILLNGLLRLGPYSATRDPRENASWYPTLSSPPDFDTSRVDVADIWSRLDAAMRQRAKLACLTMDRLTDDVWPHTSRGWGRARMWEQYADRHRGAVLIFDQVKLTEIIEQGMSRPVLHGQVAYTTGPWSHALLEGVDLVDIHTRGVRAVATDLIESAGREFFFQKDRDWSDESEYRYVVVSDSEAEFVPIRDALVAIVLGQEYPRYEKVVLSQRLSQAGVQAAAVAQLNWLNGYPHAQPLPVPAA